MKAKSNVDVEVMPVEGETVEGYIARLRDLHQAKSLAHLEARAAVVKARIDLAATRRRGAHLAEVAEVMNSVIRLSRAVGLARYEMESVEFALSEACHTVNH